MTVVKSTGYTPEDSVLSSAPTRLFSTVYSSIYRGSNAFSPLWAPGTYKVHRYTLWQNIHTCNKLINFN